MDKQVKKLNNEGVKLFLNGNFEDAKLKYKEALKVAPTYATTLNNLGMISLQEKKYKNAEALFKSAYDKQKKATYILNLGHAYANQNKIDKARESYLKSIELSPKSLMAWKSIAVLYQHQKQFQKSAHTWEYILQSLSTDAYFKIQLVKDYIELQKYQEALGVLEETSKDEKLSEYVWYYTALIHFNFKNFGLAEIAINKSILISPNSETFRTLAASIYLGLSKVDKAITQWNIILKQNQNNHKIRIDKGVTLLANRKYTEALEAFNFVLSKTNNSKALFYKALVLLEMNSNAKEAITLLRKVVKMNDDYTEQAKELITRITTNSNE
ncbi:tetratricopeptide repeat protein [Ulvibacter litoralis]|uniref:Tetratricopeptide repeat-containing protein n=1 Tax=Ulvibacter litoralis TaxID=227084 RepID=A0A1G7HI49_9FLAO|nr:tetratricopeptide repeat protein [Ulvibacter litoralis]GHC57850.1 hypothetical protein GCM10008083_23100 [Ulvibacter litoralis]SDE99954.1 Tetratricopeptide repeat-containing protein [Ulvibacter litoralis]